MLQVMDPVLKNRIIELAENHTAAQIARIVTRELGVIKTRNAIIGICRRQNIRLSSGIGGGIRHIGGEANVTQEKVPKKANVTQEKVSNSKVNTSPLKIRPPYYFFHKKAEKGVKTVPKVPELLEENMSQGKLISDLGDRECSWPFSNQTYCGIPVVKSKDRLNIWSSYCQRHHKLVHKKG